MEKIRMAILIPASGLQSMWDSMPRMFLLKGYIHAVVFAACYQFYLPCMPV